MEKPKPKQGGIGKADAVGLVFVGLKLSGQLDWSWWWILSPYWIGLALTMAVSRWFLSAAPSESLMEKVSVRHAKWSWRCRSSDAWFLLFLVLKWTGHLSWSWFWVLSPLWLFKPLGFLLARPTEERRRRRRRRRSRDLGFCVGVPAAILLLLALVALRLEGILPSWWWIAPAIPFSLILEVVLSIRMKAVFYRRLLRERAERQERRRREGASASPPTVIELWEKRRQATP